MSGKRITRKIINRHSKKYLIDFAKSNGLKVNKSTSKKIVVDLLFKNKSLRNKIPVKEKRKLSDKQRKNLERFRFKKTQNKEVAESSTVRAPVPSATIDPPQKTKVKIDPTASNKNEPAPPTLKQDPAKTKINKVIASKTITQKKPPKAIVPKTLPIKEPVVDFKTGEKKTKSNVDTLLTKKDKRYRDKPSFIAEKLHSQLGGTVFDAKRSTLDSHSYRIQKRIRENARVRRTRIKEQLISTNKTTDRFDRKVFNNITVKNKKGMKVAVARAKRNSQLFPDVDLIDEELELLQTTTSNTTRIEELLKIQNLKNGGFITEAEYQAKIRKLINVPEKKEPKSNKDKLLEQIEKKKFNLNNKLSQI